MLKMEYLFIFIWCFSFVRRSKLKSGERERKGTRMSMVHVGTKPSPNSRGPTCLAAWHVLQPPFRPPRTNSWVSPCPFTHQHLPHHNHLNSFNFIIYLVLFPIITAWIPRTYVGPRHVGTLSPLAPSQV